MNKFITFLILVLVGVYFWKRRGARLRGTEAEPPKDRPVEDMVRCRICGVNLPRSEASMSRGRFYCCDEHRQRDA